LCVGGDFICPETHGGGAVMTIQNDGMLRSPSQNAYSF